MPRGGILGAASIPFIGCVTLLSAMTLHILAFASPFWANDELEGKLGLWRTHDCQERADPNIDGNEECWWWDHEWNTSTWLQFTRALESLTILFWAIPLVVLPVYIYVALGLYYKCLLGTMTAFTLLGAICNIAGDIVAFVHIEDSSRLSVRWCLIVSLVGGVIGFIAFIIFLVSVCNRPKFVHEQHFLSGFYVDPVKNRMYVVESTEQPIQVPPQNGGTVNPGQVNPVIVSDEY